MSSNQYYCVTTRRFTLKSNHDDWLKLTQDLYNKVLLFYYRLLLDLQEDNGDSIILLSNQQILRKLEVLTIVGREKKQVLHPLPWNKIPLYFRRAAINGAISSAKSHIGRMNNGSHAGRASQFNNGITFYKGTYRNVTADKITLKVWDGDSWQWINCRLKGNFIPENGETMSPIVLWGKQETALFLPVKTLVEDGRKAKERIQQEVKVCSIQFTNEDYFAVGVVMDEMGQQRGIRFFKGGREYAGRCAEILDKIRSTERAMGLWEADKIRTGQQADEKINYKYWRKLKNISDYYAHFVSRQIIGFCNENQVKVIILPKYNEKFTNYVMTQSGKWSSIHLSAKIRELLSYKAWQAGIIVLEVSPAGTSSICEKCGAPGKRKKDAFICINGHQGNKFINSARNLGRKCLESFIGEKMDTK